MPRRPNTVLAKIYGVTPTTVGRWRKAGLPVDDEQEMARVRANRTGGRKAVDDLEGLELAEAIKRADLTKKYREIEKLDLALEVDRGKYMLVSQVREDLLRIGAAVKAQALRLESDLPPILEGLEARAMQPKIRDAVDTFLRTISEGEHTYDG